MLKVAVVGASGFSGAELVRLLLQHPQVTLTAATAETFSGQTLSQVYPAFGSQGDRITLTSLASTELNLDTAQVVFLALPHGEAALLAPKLLAQKIKVIDLSGDFRFPDTQVYTTWYGATHPAPEWARQAVYGLPELNREAIKHARLIANPGCYATAAILALLPLVKAGWVEPGSLLVDAKSGSTGAGRKAKLETQFTSLSENVVPYKLAGVHQHTPEIEQALAQIAGAPVSLLLTPQLVPARRGILALAYAKLSRNRNLTAAELVAHYEQTYASEPCVEVRSEAEAWPDLATAVGTNTCVIKPGVDPRTGWVVVAASLDNLGKGAAGQAVQNLNLMQGWPENSGLPAIGWVP